MRPGARDHAEGALRAGPHDRARSWLLTESETAQTERPARGGAGRTVAIVVAIVVAGATIVGAIVYVNERSQPEP